MSLTMSILPNLGFSCFAEKGHFDTHTEFVVGNRENIDPKQQANADYGPKPVLMERHFSAPTPRVSDGGKVSRTNSLQVTTTTPLGGAVRQCASAQPFGSGASFGEPAFLEFPRARLASEGEILAGGPRSQGRRDGLDLHVSPGDVLCVPGNNPGAISRLGTTGGFGGHVLLVTAPLRGVQRQTAEAVQFQGVWPSPSVRMLWLVRTMESTRNTEGFHETQHLLYVDDNTGAILCCAEERHNDLIRYEQPEKVQVWQCPSELRNNFRHDIMLEVLNFMRLHDASWSWSTAIRAFLFSADVEDGPHKESVLEDLQVCWGKDPICTSVVIVFWQRYLCKLADMQDADALDWIVQWMPLKSDRSLPGELLTGMQQCGWEMISQITCEGRPRLHTF